MVVMKNEKYRKCKLGRNLLPRFAVQEKVKKMEDEIKIEISERDLDKEWWNMIMEDIGIVMQQYGITPKMLIQIGLVMMEEK